MASNKGVRVAVVTGSNKGLGKAIVRGLCKQFDGYVYLTARDPKAGEQSVEDLKKEGLNPCFHQLDINDPPSIDRLRLHLEQNYGGLDVLVNNAGIAYTGPTKETFDQANSTIQTNYAGTKAVFDKVFHLLRDHARVVYLSSTGSCFSLAKFSKEAKDRIRRIKTVPEIEKLVSDYMTAVKQDTVDKSGMPGSSYDISKLSLNLLSAVQQEHIDTEAGTKDVIVNSCCPGMVDTDMSGHMGVTPNEGADTPLYLALLPPDDAANPRGKFVSNRKERDIESSEQEIKEMEELVKKMSEGGETVPSH